MQHNKRKINKRPFKGKHKGYLGVGGAAAIYASQPGLLGYKRVFHGTSTAYAAKIKKQGLLSSLGGKGKGAGSIHDHSQGRSFVSSNPFWSKDLSGNMKLTGALDDLRNESTVKGRKAAYKSNLLNPGKKRATVLQLNIPYRKWTKDFVEDFADGAVETGSYFTSQDIKAKYIKGTGIRNTLRRGKGLVKQFPSYMLRHPLRLGIGIAGTVAGASMLDEATRGTKLRKRIKGVRK